MNNQNQYLFEAPIITSPVSNQEYDSNPEWQAEWEVITKTSSSKPAIRLPVRSSQTKQGNAVLRSNSARTRNSASRRFQPQQQRSLLSQRIPSARARVLTYTTKDVINARISEPAQHSLVRLSKNPVTSADAVGMLEAVKSGQLEGIYCVNKDPSAQRVRRYGLDWWTAIPQGEDSVVIFNPDDSSGIQAMIAFRRNLDPRCGLLKNETPFPPSPAKLDAALIRAWRVYLEEIAQSPVSDFTPVAGIADEDVTCFSPQGIVPLTAQPGCCTCWAAVTTMLYSWRDQSNYTIESAMDMVGQRWRSKVELDKKQGCSNKACLGAAGEDIEFFKDAGVVAEPPANYLPSAIRGFLKKYGPLWVTKGLPRQNGSPALLHERLVVKICGDDTPNGTQLFIHDPDPNQGAYWESYNTFIKKYELGAQSVRSVILQVMHLP